MKGMQYNWMRYLCQEFLANCREAQEERNSFHYTWLLLSIVLVAWRLPEDSQFPLHKDELPKAARFALLWARKDVARIKETNILWVLMEMDLQMVINQ